MPKELVKTKLFNQETKERQWQTNYMTCAFIYAFITCLQLSVLFFMHYSNSIVNCGFSLNILFNVLYSCSITKHCLDHMHLTIFVYNFFWHEQLSANLSNDLLKKKYFKGISHITLFGVSKIIFKVRIFAILHNLSFLPQNNRKN